MYYNIRLVFTFHSRDVLGGVSLYEHMFLYSPKRPILLLFPIRKFSHVFKESLQSVV